MTKLSTRNAKNMIIELVIIVRIVVTHKMLQIEDVNPAVTLWLFLTSRDKLLRKANPGQLVQ